MNLEQKFSLLKNRLDRMESALVAFSGGVDSTFLLKTALDVMGTRVMAVTVTSVFQPESEIARAKSFLETMPSPYHLIEVDILSDARVAANPSRRCYFCKTILFQRIVQIARKQGIAHVLDGTHADDLSDFRPGLKALQELGIESPLKEADLSKDEIRLLSQRAGLAHWNAPPLACLATRIPPGTPITRQKLKRIDRAEAWMRERGLSPVRLRDHGETARIETAPEAWKRIIKEPFRTQLVQLLKESGFKFIALDLTGYRTGSLNKESHHG